MKQINRSGQLPLHLFFFFIKCLCGEVKAAATKNKNSYKTYTYLHILLVRCKNISYLQIQDFNSTDAFSLIVGTE